MANFIFNTGIVLSFFLGTVLFTKKNKVLSDKILAFWLFIIGFHLLNYSIYTLGYWEKYPHLIGITVPLPFLHGPLLFLYVCYSLKNEKHLEFRDYLHFVPSLLTYIYMLPFYFGYSAEEKMKVDKGLVDDYEIFSLILVVGFIISGLTYVTLTLKKLIHHKKYINDNFSSHENIKLNWLKFSIFCVLGLFLTAAVVTILRDALNYQFTFDADLLFYSFIVLFVVYVGYSGIRQQNLFADNVIENKEPNKKLGSEYKKSGLKPETAEIKHKELLKIMADKKPYLNSKLTLSQLAKSLNISANHLSQIINQYENINFYDFVNNYRVNEFIERAQHNKNFNYLTHAFDSGFNSKSSFNSVFKKLKHSTPSQYMAELKK